MLQVVWWYLVVFLVGILAWPICAFLFPAFRDRGYAFARSAGLMLSGFLFWLLADFQVLQNNLGGVLTSLIIVLAITITLQWKGKSPSYRTLFRENRTTIFIVEGLFLVTFVLIALWRAANPDITGTEKPMELAFINSILRSKTFPPADPWLSGYSISYYYFGYVIISMLIRLTGVVSGIAFNLTAATIFSMTAVGLYGLVFNLINAPAVQKWLNRGRKQSGPSYLLPLFAPLFTLIVSNFEGLFEIFYARGWFWQKAADGSWTSWFWRWVNLQELTTYPTQPLSWEPSRPNGVLWWRASRVLADYKLTGDFQEVIDEFPFFSFLLSDLHPHVLALPFAVLALAFGLNLILGGAKGKTTFWNIDIHLPLAQIIAVPVFIGGMVFMNTWDFPVHLGIFLLCYLAMRVMDDGWTRERFWDLVAAGVVLGGLSIICYLPFLIGFSSQAGGIVPSFIFYTRGIQLWMMFGTLLIPVIFFLFMVVRKSASWTNLTRGLIWSSALVFGLWIVSFLLAAVALKLPDWSAGMAQSASPGIAALGNTLIDAGNMFRYAQGLEGESVIASTGSAIWNRLQYPGAWITLWLIFTLAFGLVSAVIQKRDAKQLKEAEEEDETGSTLPVGAIFALILVISGALVILVPEFVYLRDQFGNRMNTIFKFYYQGWLFMSIAASFSLIYLLKRIEVTPFQIAALILTAFGICSGLIYPCFGVSSTTNGLHPSRLDLNGNAYLDIYQADEAAAMNWLSQAPYGVLAESVGGSYSAHARMSTHSGLPAVIGWTPHEGQWGRTEEQMGGRDQDISTLYNTPDWYEAKSILDKYHIRYIVIGYLERATYAELNEAKFASNLSIVFQNPYVTIYEYPGSVYETN